MAGLMSGPVADERLEQPLTVRFSQKADAILVALLVMRDLAAEPGDAHVAHGDASLGLFAEWDPEDLREALLRARGDIGVALMGADLMDSDEEPDGERHVARELLSAHRTAVTEGTAAASAVYAQALAHALDGREAAESVVRDLAEIAAVSIMRSATAGGADYEQALAEVYAAMDGGTERD
jgi:hypothetical protein